MRLTGLFVLVLGLLAGSPFIASSQKLDPAFESLIDEYLAEFHDVGTWTTAVNDGSAAYYQNRLDTARGLLDGLHATDREALSFQQDIDYRYLEGILKTKVMDGEKVKYWEKDPTLYLRIEPIVSARGGLLYLENRPVTDRAATVLAVMKTIPARLENAKINLKVFIPLWLDPAKGLLEGAIETFEVDVPRFADRVPDQRVGIAGGERESVGRAPWLRGFLGFRSAAETRR